jgi:hypothetical protein
MKICITIFIVALCLLIGTLIYKDFQEFTSLLPKCKAAGGELYKIGGDYVCVKDLLKEQNL